MKNKKIIILILFLIILFFVLNKNDKFASDVVCPQEIINQTEIIKEGIAHVEGKDYDYQLLRLKGEERPAYALYIKNKRPETVLITRPYAKIDWTCEAGDKDFKNIVTPEQVVNDSMIYLYNGFPVLNVFPRFFSEGDIDDEISDVVAGLEFLKDKKVGIYGSSWGGFQAIFGAVKTDYPPIIGALSFPPTDMGSWVDWSIKTGEDFFETHQERCQNATNGNYTEWSHEFIIDNLKTDFLIYHVYEDTLVPVEQTIDLAQKTDKITAFLGHREEEKLSHGKKSPQNIVDLNDILGPAYLMRGLTADEITILADVDTLQEIEDDFAKEIILDEKLILFEAEQERILTQNEKIELFK